MQKAIDLVKKISTDFDKNWLDELEERNLHYIFQSIYTLNITVGDANKIVCYIIYAYSPESLWLDLRADRIENKTRILSNLDVKKSELFQEILYNKNEIVGISIFNYLEEIKSWKWRAIFDLLEYSSKMFRFATQETEEEKTFEKMNKEGEIKSVTQEYNIDVIAKVNKEKGLLLEQAIAKRRQADTLLEEIKKEYVNTDYATQRDFSFSFTDTSKKRDILSWRDFIKDEVVPMKEKNKNPT
jgi:hypothetical protein